MIRESINQVIMTSKENLDKIILDMKAAGLPEIKVIKLKSQCPKKGYKKSLL